MSTIRSSYFEPRSLSQLLSSALREATSHSASGFVTVALILLPMALLQLVGAYVMTELGITEVQKQMQSGQMAPGQFDVKPFLIFAAFQIVSAVIAFVLAYFAVASVARLFAERAIGKDIGAMGAWDASLRSFFKVLAGSIVQMLMYGAAFLVLLIPLIAVSAVLSASLGQQAAGSSLVIQVVAGGMLLIALVILGTYLCPMPSVSAIEDLGAFGTVGRSFGLISGNFGRTFLAILIGVVCIAVPMGVLNWVMNGPALEPLQASFGDSPGVIVAAIPSALVLVLVVPFMYSLQTLIYFDVRSRNYEQEDFSPVELAFDLGEALPESAVSPATSEPPSGSAT